MKNRYYPKIGFIVFIGALILSTVTICRSEEITLTTYYPSPYGVYSEMRLYPKPDSTTPCVNGNTNSQPGVMFYDSNDNQLKVCLQTGPNAYSWQLMGGGWSLTGNAGTNPATNFIGTTDIQDWAIRTSNTERMRITSQGLMGIGNTLVANNLLNAFGGTETGGLAVGFANGSGVLIAKNPTLSGPGVGIAGPGGVAAIGMAADVAGYGYLEAYLGRDLMLKTRTANSVIYMRDTTGRVGIGTTNPQAKLDIGGFANGRRLLLGQSPGGDAGFVVSDNSILTGKFGGAFVAQPVNGNRFVLASYRGNPISFWTTADSTGAGFLERLTIIGSGLNAGFVGIGTTNPQETLHVNGDVFAAGNFFKSGNLWAINTAITAWGAEGGVIAGFNNGRTIALGQTGAGAYTGLGITSGSTLLASFYAGNEVGIGTYLNGPSQIRMWAEQAPGFAGADIMVQKNGNIVMRTQQMNRLTIDSLGNVFIPGNVNVSGAKNFKIPHPLDQEHKYLIHSCLEGPEAGVYYRGEGQLKEGITQVSLPEYFEALTRKDGRSVLLTNIDGGDILYVETQESAQIRDGKFIVKSSNTASSQRFNWEVKAVRGDIEPLKAEASK